MTAESVQRWAVTPEEFSERTGQPVQTVREMCRDGRIGARRFGKRWFIPMAEVERLLGVLNTSPAEVSFTQEEIASKVGYLKSEMERLLQMVTDLEGSIG